MDEVFNSTLRRGFLMGINTALELHDRQRLFGQHTTSANRLKWIEDELTKVKTELEQFAEQIEEARKNGDKLATDQ